MSSTAGDLKVKKIIHTVGPIYDENKDGQDKELADCYNNSIKLASEKGLKTIAFPAISTGVYKFPKRRAAKITLSAIKESIEKYRDIEKVIIVCFGEENFDIYNELY